MARPQPDLRIGIAIALGISSTGTGGIVSAMADAANVLASGAALVMISTSRPTIDPSVSLKALFGIEDAYTVWARALH